MISSTEVLDHCVLKGTCLQTASAVAKELPVIPCFTNLFLSQPVPRSDM